MGCNQYLSIGHENQANLNLGIHNDKIEVVYLRFTVIWHFMRTIGFYSLKVAGLIGFLAGYMMLTLTNPHPVKDFKQFSQYYGLFTVGSMIMEAPTVDDLPFRDQISPALGKIGQMVIAGVAFTFLVKITPVLLGSSG